MASSSSLQSQSQSSSFTKDEPPNIGSVKAKSTNLVMQIVIRRDLITKLDWTVGPVMTQAAHAATAVLHLHRDLPEVKRYLDGDDGKGWETMRKVTMEVPDEVALMKLKDGLEGLKPKIPYHLWIEQPEGIPTALALIPNRRPKALKKLLDDVGCDLWR